MRGFFQCTSCEPLVNAELGDVPAKEKLDADSNAVVISGKLDVEISFDAHAIAIESERLDIGRNASAIDASIKRLLPLDKFRVVDAKVAIVPAHPADVRNFQ